MKSIFKLALVFTLIAQTSFSQSASLFGIENPELARFFLEEAMEIAQGGPGTRDPFANSDSDTEELSEFQILQEAYRADPEATLDLIERILKAGRTR